MDVATPTKPLPPSKPARCSPPSRSIRPISKSPPPPSRPGSPISDTHGWTDHDLDIHWLSRARSGVTR